MKFEEILHEETRYSDSQIMAILRQAEAGTPVPELCRGPFKARRPGVIKGPMD
jgi:hypothetical protein